MNELAETHMMYCYVLLNVLCESAGLSLFTSSTRGQITHSACFQACAFVVFRTTYGCVKLELLSHPN